MFIISLDTQLATLKESLANSSNGDDLNMFMGINFIENIGGNVRTVREVLEYSLENCDQTAQKMISYVQARIKTLLVAHDLSEVNEWLIEQAAAGQEEFRTSSFYPNLCTYSPAKFDIQPIDVSGRRFHKVLVISGESGVGKSFAAVKLFPAKVLPENVKKTIVFYCCRDKEIIDLDATSKQKRDEAAREQLENWFQECWRKLKKKFPSVETNEWQKTSIVMVIDELGNRPMLLRGIISVAAEFEMKHTQVYERDVTGVQYVKDVRLICVGTGLDWRVRTLGEIAGEGQNYLHLQILPWSREAFHQYALKRFGEWTGNRINIESLLTSLFSLKLSRLGSNARCAKFLVDELTCKKFLNSLSPGSVLYNLRTEIFSHVANRYRCVNGIGSLFRDQEHALQLLFEALRFAYIGKVEQIQDSEKVVKLLTYGVLSYDGSCLRMSSAILLMLLSEFGTRDLSVLDGYGFEKLVALRELCHILIEYPLAKVEIIALSYPIPNTRANSKQDKTTITWSLPNDYFCLDASSDRYIQKVHQDAFYVIINGPCAPAADIIVLPPKTLGTKTRFIQAKKYQGSYNPSLRELKLEIGKFGLDRETHPATYVVMTALAGDSAQPTFSFVSSTNGDQLLQKLKSLSSQEPIIQDDQYCSHVVIPRLDGTSNLQTIFVEVIHPLWKELVADSDPSGTQTSFTATIQADNSIWTITGKPLWSKGNGRNIEKVANSQNEVDEEWLPDLESSSVDEVNEVDLSSLNIHDNK